MATIQKRGNTYLIRVSSGYDINGKQIIKSLTYKPEKGMTEKQVEKEVEKQAVLFEKKVKDGVCLDSNITFAAFTEKWLNDYAEKQLQPKTLARYKELLERINLAIGHIKLEKLQPHHLLEFYQNLAENGINNKKSYTASDKLISIIKSNNIKELALSSGLNERTIKSIGNGNPTNYKSCEKLLYGLKIKDDKLFKVVGEEKGLSSKTILHHHRLVSSILTTAVQWQVLYSNPAERVKPPKVERKEAKYLDDEQARNVIELLNNEEIKYKTAITILIYSGLRRGELCGLEWQDIDFENEVININKSSQYLKDKGIFEKDTKNLTSNRSIKLNGEVFKLLAEYKLWQNAQKKKCGDLWVNGDRLFTQWDGKPIHPDTLTAWFNKFVKKNNLPDTSIHSLRHTNATLLINGGVPVRIVADRLGHAQPTTTNNIYSHAIKAAQAAASEVLGDILNPVDKNSKKA